jgi:hypothetical protein
MARLNIEECWWSDPRRMKLIELVGTMAADGVAINAWRVAQEFWAKCELVPHSIWQHVQANDKLIQANLAEEREGGIYVKGSSEYLEWVRERRRAASAGGKKSAEKRTKKQQKPQAKRKQNEANGKQTQPSGSGSDSFSGSDSSSGSVIPAEPSLGDAARDFIQAYCERFKARWGSNPPIQGKDAGIAKRVAKGWSPEKRDTYLDAYFSMPDAWVVKAKHPINLFETKLNEISVFAQSGEFHTQRQVRDADNSATNAMLLEKVKRGEI